MAERADAGYFTGTEYPTAVYPLQSPVAINHAALANGYPAPDLIEPFAYCELGCGAGLTVNTLAGCYPHATFHAIDFMEEHIAKARADARAAGLTNITFHHASIIDLDPATLPAFDYVTMHGVWAWVGEPVRRAIVRFLDQALKPGGLVYVSYNALPGAAAAMPLRDALRRHVRQNPDDPIAGIREGMAHLAWLKEQGALVFRNIAHMGGVLDAMRKMDPRLVAHEYLNDAWTPMHVEQVASDLAPAGLRLAGGARLRDNLLDFLAPTAFHEALRGIEDRIAFETECDLILNRHFRTDIFVRSAAPPDPPAAALARFGARIFGTHQARESFKDRIETQSHAIEIKAPVFAKIADALCRQPLSLDELAALPALAGEPPANLVEALNVLAAADWLAMFAGAPRPSELPAGARTRLSSFNRWAIVDQLPKGGGAVLASPVAGNGVHVSMIHGLLLMASGAVGEAEAPEWCLAQMKSGGGQGDDEKARGALTRAAERFWRGGGRARYLALGIIEPA
jgi:SAM-dependent methyltransferase